MNKPHNGTKAWLHLTYCTQNIHNTQHSEASFSSCALLATRHVLENTILVDLYIH